MWTNTNFRSLLLPAGLLLALASLYWLNHTELEPNEEEREALEQTILGRYEMEYEMTHDPKTNTIPVERLLEALQIAEMRRLQKDAHALPIFWEERGPTNVGGRTRGLLIDANDPTGLTVWAAGVDGGLWVTENIDAGNPNWRNIDDFFDNLAISTIAQDPMNADNMYFGTGECWGNFDAVVGPGLGVWSSIDGGENWERMPPINACVNKIVVLADGTVLAATNGGLRQFNPLNNTWPPILAQGLFANGNFVSDVEIAANGDLYAGVYFDGVYRSTDNGMTWNPVNTGLPTSGYGRIELACAPNNAATVYVIYQDTANATSGNCLAVFGTTNSGAMWNAATCPGSFGKQAWYDLILAVDPNNASRLWAGGVNLSVSNDGGANWTAVPGIHSDHHAIVYRQGSSDEMVLGNDGGVYRITDGSAAVPTPMDRNNGYNVTQFYACAMHPTLPDVILGGTQDNGTQRFSNPGLSTTTQPVGADGGWCFIDDDNPAIQIASTQYGVFRLATDGANFGATIVPYVSDPYRRFITPAEYDADSNVLYVADTIDMFGRVTDVGGGNNLTFETVSAFGNSRVSAFAISKVTPDRVFMGLNSGGLFMIDNADQNGGITATNLNAPSGNYLSSVAVDANNDNHLLISYSNYGVVSIFETTDGGATWVDVEGDFAPVDIPVRWVMFHPFDSTQALIATEVGVWSTSQLDGADTRWNPTNNFGLANVRIDMLRYRSTDHVVAAATHGRGMYTTDYFSLLADCPPTLDLTGMVASGIYIAQDLITSDGTVADGSKVIYQSGETIVLQVGAMPDQGFTAERGSDFWALILPCDTDDNFAPDPAEELTAGEDEYLDDPPNEQVLQPDPPDLASGREHLHCYPNPASFIATVEFDLPEEKFVQITVLDAFGRTREVLTDGLLAPGIYRFDWDASNYESGLYLIQARTENSGQTVKVFVVR